MQDTGELLQQLASGEATHPLSWETACDLYAQARTRDESHIRVWRDRLAQHMRESVMAALDSLPIDPHQPEISWLIINLLNRNLILAQMEMDSLHEHAQWRQDCQLVDVIRLLECMMFMEEETYARKRRKRPQ